VELDQKTQFEFMQMENFITIKAIPQRMTVTYNNEAQERLAAANIHSSTVAFSTYARYAITFRHEDLRFQPNQQIVVSGSTTHHGKLREGVARRRWCAVLGVQATNGFVYVDKQKADSYQGRCCCNATKR